MVPIAYEQNHKFPALTLLGNLNEVPERIAMVRGLAVDVTFRRRLVVFQHATGIEPPKENERFRLPSEC